MDLIKLANAQKTSELRTCSLWVYENTPCSYCRHKIVEILVKLNQAPKALMNKKSKCKD